MILQTVHILILICVGETASITFMDKADEDRKNEDEAAFREAMEGVEPIDDLRVDPYRRKRRPVPVDIPVGDEDEDEFGDMAIETGDFLEFRRPGIQNRLFRDLQRGAIETEGTLDLHGLRVHEAKPALVRFLNHSLAIGRRCVRIIHGKGRGSGARQPVLKQKANQWLRQKDEVLAFVTAPRWDGGTGAVYVLLSGKYRQHF
jgi:DNA-nicking Smr family endonuclease